MGWQDDPVVRPWEQDPVASKGVAPRPAAMSMNNPPRGMTQEPSGKSWGDVASEALSNIPSSAATFAENLAQPFLHPVDTAESLYALTKGVASKLAPSPTAPAPTPRGMGLRMFSPRQETPQETTERASVEAPANALGQFFADRYGSVEGFKNTIATDPVGMLADASTVMTAGGALPIRGASVVGRVGAAIDPLTQTGNALRLGGKGAEFVTSNALGASTGATARDVRAAGRAGLEGGKAGEAFTGQMRGSAAKDQPIELAKSAMDQLGAERSAAYRGGMVDISKDRTVLDFVAINAAVDKAGSVGTFKGANIAPAANDINAQLRSVVRDWETLDPKSPLFKDVAPGDLTAANFHTPEGLDALKRTVGNLRDSTGPGTPERVAADRVYRAVWGEIKQQAPAYAKVMGDYAQASDELSELTKTFSLREGTSPDTSLRKLQSTSRNNVQTNYGGRTQLLDRLAEFEPSLPYALAGQNMNALAPRGLVAKLLGGTGGAAAGALNPALLAAAPAFSPRVVGEAAYLGGRAAGMTGDAANALHVNAANARAAGQGSYQAGRYDDDTRNRALELRRGNALRR